METGAQGRLAKLSLTGQDKCDWGQSPNRSQGILLPERSTKWLSLSGRRSLGKAARSPMGANRSKKVVRVTHVSVYGNEKVCGRTQ